MRKSKEYFLVLFSIDWIVVSVLALLVAARWPMSPFYIEIKR